MKIGIISSGNETLALRKILTPYNHEYLVYHDQLFFPFGSKDITSVIEVIQKAVTFLTSQGAEKIIVDPIYELALWRDASLTYLDGGVHRSYREVILPIFQTYLYDYAFNYSLVGKIWILTDVWSQDVVQSYLVDVAKQYQLTDHQKNTKKFSFPFSYRVKSANAWPYGIAALGVHNPYLIRTLKNDLRYFKDAKVDTLLPMQYHYFRMQRTMKAFFNFHTTRFHDLSVVEECFQKLVEHQVSSPYCVRVRTNQDPKFLLKEKELVWLLERGKSVKMKIERI